MLINGREIAQEILGDLKKRIEVLKARSQTPNLAIILVGSDPASSAYTLAKKNTLEEIGGRAKIYKFSPSASNEGIIGSIEKIRNDKKTNGLIVQLPLSKNLNTEKILNAIKLKYDIDGFLPNSHFTPPIAKAIEKILETVFKGINLKNKNHKLQILNLKSLLSTTKSLIINSSSQNKKNEEFFNWLKTKNITIVGKGETGGKPVINWFKSKNINYNLIDSKSKNSNQILKTSDIIISAVGKEGFEIKKDQVKQGVILLGIGLRQDKKNKFIGDYKMENIKNKASFYTATIGGIGPVNVAYLLENLIIATEKNIL